METINYNISKTYLSHWGLNEALREIMQNFMNYGDYNVQYGNSNIQFGMDDITISNNFILNGLNFLAIGLKMALLVFAREDIPIIIKTDKLKIIPSFKNTITGETFCLDIIENRETNKLFSISFILPFEQWKSFYSDIIK